MIGSLSQAFEEQAFKNKPYQYNQYMSTYHGEKYTYEDSIRMWRSDPEVLMSKSAKVVVPKEQIAILPSVKEVSPLQISAYVENEDGTGRSEVKCTDINNVITCNW